MVVPVVVVILGVLVCDPLPAFVVRESSSPAFSLGLLILGWIRVRCINIIRVSEWLLPPWFMRALTAWWEKNLGLWSGSGGDRDGSEVSRLPSKTLTPGCECGRTNFIERNMDEREQMEVGIYMKCEDKNASQGWNIKQTKLVGINLQFMCWRMSYLYSMSYSCLVASYLQGTGTSKASILTCQIFEIPLTRALRSWT